MELPETSAPADSPGNGVPALERGLDVLELLSRTPEGLGITELAAALSLNKNAIFRIAHTLAARGYLLRDEPTKRFRLSAKMLTVGQPRCGEVSLTEAALEPMRRLRDETRETVQLGVRAGDEGVIIEQAGGLHALRIAVDAGLRFPLHSNAPGKALLAYSSEAERGATLDRLTLTRFTQRTITRRDELERECARIRLAGYSTDFAEADEGIHCVAAPICGKHGETAAVLWVSAPSRRLPKDAFSATGRLVKGAAADISRRIQA